MFAIKLILFEDQSLNYNFLSFKDNQD